jgi:hypothetical protein
VAVDVTFHPWSLRFKQSSLDPIIGHPAWRLHPTYRIGWRGNAGRRQNKD